MKKMTLCYVHVPGCSEHEAHAQKFVESYKAFPPGHDHDTVIICQGHPLGSQMRTILSELPNLREYVHDDTGWDIGGYIALAKSGHAQSESMLCCGGTTTFRKAGWMARMVEAWDKHGPGFYGSLTSFQIRPHFNTTGFWTAPFMLGSYPGDMVTREQRYNFEHGKQSLWWMLNQVGYPTKLVTWDGEYDWPEWRKPDNISCRGDQSNCLTFFRINYQFEHYCAADPGAKNSLMYLTDAHVTDPWFREKLKGLTPLGDVVEG